MTDEPKTCEQCAAWEPLIIVCRVPSNKGRCRKLDIRRMDDEPACEHYEEEKEG